MKTTFDLDDDLLARAKALAALERISLTRLVEQGLALRLRSSTRRAAAVPRLPVYPSTGGLVPGVNPLSNQALLDAADDDA